MSRRPWFEFWTTPGVGYDDSSRSTRRRGHARRRHDLVDDKAWRRLGITGGEFRRCWWAGRYRTDPGPAAVALDNLMLTGTWGPPAAPPRPAVWPVPRRSSRPFPPPPRRPGP